MVFQENSEGVSSREFQECFQEVTWMFQGRLKFFFKDLRVFKRILKEVQRIFQVSFIGISRKFHGCFKKVSRVCQC